MKLNFFIPAIIAAFCIMMNSCSSKPPMQPEARIEFRNNAFAWKEQYVLAAAKKESLQKRLALQQQIAENWAPFADTALNIIRRKEIVYVKRMASSSIMNNPAFYQKRYSGNTVTEKGKGADNEDIVMIYLSDGTIIKSSPRSSPEWLGVVCGEKVLKTTGAKLNAVKFQKLRYYAARDTLTHCSGHYYSALNEFDFYCRYPSTREFSASTDFEFVEYTTYQPLFSK